MKSLNVKLALAAVAIAALATPTLAAQSQQQPKVRHRPIYNYSVQSPQQQVGTYPNGAARTGSEENVESGAAFNLLKN